MKIINIFGGIKTEYELVFTILKKPIMKLGKDGFFYNSGKARGVLVMRVQENEVWYHMPEDYLEWKTFLRIGEYI